MKQLLLFLILIFFTLTSRAQWISQATGFDAPSLGINQIVTVSPQVVWATAYDGSGNGDTLQDFTRTTDGGNTWIPGNVNIAPSYYDWSCMAAVDENTAWAMFWDQAAGSTGAIYKTTDGGQTWAQEQAGIIFSDAASFPDVIYFWDANNGVAVGDPINGEFEIYTTVDGGDNWDVVDAANIPNPQSGEYAYTRIFSVGKNGTLWYGTNKGRVFKTIDMGYTWTASSAGVSLVETMAVKDDNMAWVRRLAVLKRTTNGGTNWSTVTPSSGHYFQGDLAYIPFTINTIISTGSNTATGIGTSYSLDGGDNWVTIDTGIQHIAVNFFDNENGWSGGFNFSSDSDGIFKYAGTFDPTGITSFDASVKFKLYPNPSNGLFYFSFDAENNQPIHISVTDEVGKSVFNKIYKDKSQTWLRSIDMRGFSKGVYFLELENEGNHSAQKLVIE